jgi:hypothetical protein
MKILPRIKLEFKILDIKLAVNILDCKNLDT